MTTGKLFGKTGMLLNNICNSVINNFNSHAGNNNTFGAIKHPTRAHLLLRWPCNVAQLE